VAGWGGYFCDQQAHAEMGGQRAGLAKMRRRFLRGPSRHLLYGVDRSHFAIYLQVVVQKARVPLRRQRDGCVALRFPPDFAPLQRGHRSVPRLHVELFHVNFGTRHQVVLSNPLNFSPNRLVQRREWLPGPS
jgi:hypothetical protein